MLMFRGSSQKLSNDFRFKQDKSFMNTNEVEKSNIESLKSYQEITFILHIIITR